jgi:transcriptional regulator with XRE-family HTH domain
MSELASCLSAARAMLGMSQAEVEAETRIERRTIGRVESGKFKLVPREAYKLRSLYEKLEVEFLSSPLHQTIGVRWKCPGRDDPFRSAQFRAARAMLSLSQREMAALSGIDKNFISRLETNKPKAVLENSVQRLAVFVHEAGIELTPEGDYFGVGVRLRLRGT